jgi:hypothetical protein
LLGFFRTYSQFYKDHRSRYRHNRVGATDVQVGAGQVAASLLLPGGGHGRTLHLVNHNYDRGVIAQRNFSVQVDLPHCPRRITMISPDFSGSRTPASSCRHGALTVTVDRLDYYNVLVLT